MEGRLEGDVTKGRETSHKAPSKRWWRTKLGLQRDYGGQFEREIGSQDLEISRVSGVRAKASSAAPRAWAWAGFWGGTLGREHRREAGGWGQCPHGSI